MVAELTCDASDTSATSRFLKFRGEHNFEKNAAFVRETWHIKQKYGS